VREEGCAEYERRIPHFLVKSPIHWEFNMPLIRDLAYYGGNANNQRYLESLAAAKAAPAAQAQVNDVPVFTDAQQALITAAELAAQMLPVAPSEPPAWKAKA
jgi:hypothetical protein